ncbi:hypothetical protein NDU88_005688 [Pleurodeles waltl]|uniref:Uncharacterized protein n=1 Tax=Pleurodeles waltl TaxID=8319 RepID=A0AAV7UIQ9_PLEWA|nr:hypothetical protein NDU88_005688 [Pleurodeles waltl]
MGAWPDNEAVRAALLNLGAALHTELLWSGVLKEAWVGLERLTRAVSKGLATTLALKGKGREGGVLLRVMGDKIVGRPKSQMVAPDCVETVASLAVCKAPGPLDLGVVAGAAAPGGSKNGDALGAQCGGGRAGLGSE